MKSREDMFPPESKIEAFLSDLVVNGKVAVSTQSQAFNALLFVYEQVLHHRLGKVESVRATRPVRVPTVLTPEEARSIIGNMSGTPQLVVKLIYGGEKDKGPRLIIPHIGSPSLVVANFLLILALAKLA